MTEPSAPGTAGPSQERGGVDWPPLVGGADGLRQLEAALAAPVHAYLLLGTVVGDKRAVARAFAGELLAAVALGSSPSQSPGTAPGGDESADSATSSNPTAEADRHRQRARQGTHPDVVLIEPEGRALLAGDATALITEASRRSLEGAGKVIICDRFHTAAPGVAASLLKTIEEPPARTTIVLLADDVPAGHRTVASRCVIVRFPAPAPESVRQWLIDSGVPAPSAARAARAIAADVTGVVAPSALDQLPQRLDAWWSVPQRLDGTGATAARLVDELRELIEAATAAATADVADGGSGVPDGFAEAGRESSEGRDRRRRRARDAELRFGLAVLAGHYAEQISAPDVGADRADAAAEALDLLRTSAAALIRNPDEKLLLQNLLLHLPRL